MNKKKQLTDIDIEQIILMTWGEKAWDAFARPYQQFCEQVSKIATRYTAAVSGYHPLFCIAYNPSIYEAR
jgi:hypothetical protein